MRTCTCSHSVSTCSRTHIICLPSNTCGPTVHQTTLLVYSPAILTFSETFTFPSLLDHFHHHTDSIQNTSPIQNKTTPKTLPILHFPFQLLPHFFIPFTANLLESCLHSLVPIVLLPFFLEPHSSLSKTVFVKGPPMTSCC